jgi:hypothetical protein
LRCVGTPNLIPVPVDIDAKEGGGVAVDEEVALAKAYHQVVTNYNAGKKAAETIQYPDNPYHNKTLPWRAAPTPALASLLAPPRAQAAPEVQRVPSFTPALVSTCHPNSPHATAGHV